MMAPKDAFGTSASGTDRLFGELLVSKGFLTHRELVEALNHQHHEGGRLGEVLTRLKMLTDEEVANALAEHLSMDSVRLDDIHKVDMNIARMIPEGIAKRFSLVAIGEIDGRVVLAMADPLNVMARDTIAGKLNRAVKVVVGSSIQMGTSWMSPLKTSKVRTSALKKPPGKRPSFASLICC
ncbi:MAG: GspE/PulE/PilB domain-containing protein [Planctomycetota bacterium]|jgi:hypothetical protein